MAQVPRTGAAEITRQQAHCSRSPQSKKGLTMFQSVSLRFICSLLVVLASVTLAEAQTTETSPRLHATRAELEQLLAVYEQRASAAGISAEQRISSEADAAMVRRRLQEGDFQPGDEVTVFVDGHPEISAAYTVDPTRSIMVPGVGAIPLRGVLRSELDEYLGNYLAQYVRDPRVRAASTIRVMVLGSVGKPGFYSVPSHALVTDVIDVAGGTGANSRLTQIRIERDGRRLMPESELQDAIIEGRTLDQLNVRAGDRIVVPRARSVQVREALGWVGAVGSVVWLVYRIGGRRR
jgi:protein involved in polysaccharide export with SLBB domain